MTHEIVDNLIFIAALGLFTWVIMLVGNAGLRAREERERKRHH